MPREEGARQSQGILVDQALQSSQEEGKDTESSMPPPPPPAALQQPPTGPATVVDTAASGSGSGGDEGQQRASLTERTRQFLEKAKEKTIEGVKARMGKDSLIYEAISSSNTRSTMAANLLGKSKIPAPKMTGLLDLADGRVMSGGLQLDMTNK
jgi:hypothetical protein